MSKKVIIVIFFIISCNTRIESIGEINEVIIIADSKDKFQVEPIVEEMFSHTVRTPQIEPKYKIKWPALGKIDFYKRYSNIIVLSISETIDSTGDVLFDKIAEKYNISDDIFAASDVFVRNQLLLCIKAYDSIDLKEKFINQGEWILNQIDDQINQNVRNLLKVNNQNREVKDILRSEFNISGDIGEDYKIIKYVNDDKFLWIGRGYPYRWLILNQFSGEMSNSKDFFWDLFVEKTKIHMPDIIISDKFRESYTDILGDGRKVRALSGLYEHIPSDTGGPFFVYLIDRKKADDMIMASGFVNYPENEKYGILKRLEVTIKDLNFNIKE